MPEKRARHPLPSFVQAGQQEGQFSPFFEDSFPGPEYTKNQVRNLDLFVQQVHAFLREEYPEFAVLFEQAPHIAAEYAEHILKRLYVAWTFIQIQREALKEGNLDVAIMSASNDQQFIHAPLSELGFEQFLICHLAKMMAMYHPYFNSIPSAAFNANDVRLIIENDDGQEVTSTISADDIQEAIIKQHKEQIEDEIKPALQQQPIATLMELALLGGEEALKKLQELQGR